MTKPLPFWHPAAFALRKPFLDMRQRAIKALRHYFDDQEFAEVDTPILQVSPGAEVHLAAFGTKWKGGRPGENARLYLQTSPEFAMKKLLVAGVPKLFQFAHAFRNGERSSHHHPEFLMLEWYRANATTENLMKDCVTMVREMATATKSKIFSTGTKRCDPFLEWERLSVENAFTRATGIDILATAPDPQNPERDLLAKEALKIDVHVDAKDTWDDLFFRIMGEKIEPFLGQGRPTFLVDYPLSMAALARKNPKDPRLAERFELYMCGVELANAFGELTCAKEQEARLIKDMAQKQKLYGETWPIDESFIEALKFGMPPSAGIALGVDRLIMLCAGATTIDEVLWAPVNLDPPPKPN